ncbi:choice-of-anchor J domain-containing protein [Epilithonimonas sp. UC225_85]|uniref:choice-of-anchor J domain-containing protein n=1 Tax=Epilithonimonas sp. UC225_85 TaxID=3350167 RepID=UPI0036D24620
MNKALTFFSLLSILFTFGQTDPVSLPYSNSFETEAEQTYWYNINTGAGTPWAITDETSTVYQPSQGQFYARAQSDYENGGSAWLISKGIKIEAGHNIALDFDYRSGLSTAFPVKLKVVLKQQPIPTLENATELWVNEEIQINTYQNVHKTFEVPQTGTYYLAFYFYPDPNLGYLSLDNINLYEELCPKPVNVKSVPGQATADIFWESASVPGAGFEYVIQSQGTGIPTGSGTPVQGTSTTAQGLQPQTQYELYVRSVCVPGSVYGKWSGPVAFKTYPATTAVPVNLPYKESFEGESHWALLEPMVGNSWVRSDSDAGGLYGPSDGDYYLRHDDIDNNSNSWVFSRGINLPAGKEITLQFDYKSSQDEYYPQKMKVVVSKDAFPSGKSVQIWDNNFIQNSNYTTATVTFTVPENGVYYLGYQAYSDANYGYLMFDNVKVSDKESSPCEYILRLKDSEGDGWNNNTMNLYVNGDAVFTDLTLPIGDVLDFPFQINSGDAVTTIWNGGSHSGYQTSYEILDSNGNVVGSASEQNISTPIIASCPNCAKPSKVVANYGQTTVDLTWDYLTQPASGYEYVVQPAGTGTPSSGITVSNNQAHVEGLSPETAYEVYVRSNCGENNFSSWSGPVNFTTLPSPGSAVNLPYNYGFENEDQWITQSISRNNQWMIDQSYPATGEFNGSQKFNYYFDANSWYFSRGLNLQGGKEILIKFKYRSIGSNVPMSLSIADKAYAFVQKDNVIWSKNVSSDKYEEAILSFTPTASGVYYLGFNSLATKGTSALIDDIQVYMVGLPDPPECEYTCPENKTVYTNPGNIGAVVKYNLTFACEGASTGVFSVLTEGLPSGAIFPVGETTVKHNLIFNGEVIDTCSFVVKVEEKLGTADNTKDKGLQYYPNPVVDKLTVKMDGDTIDNITIYNFAGSVVKSEKTNAKTANIDMRNLSSGVYIVNVRTSTNVKSFKVIKE